MGEDGEGVKKRQPGPPPPPHFWSLPMLGFFFFFVNLFPQHSSLFNAKAPWGQEGLFFAHFTPGIVQAPRIVSAHSGHPMNSHWKREGQCRAQGLWLCRQLDLGANSYPATYKLSGPGHVSSAPSRKSFCLKIVITSLSTSPPCFLTGEGDSQGGYITSAGPHSWKITAWTCSMSADSRDCHSFLHNTTALWAF